MFAGPMRKDYALSLIDRFPPLPKGRPFPRIDPAELIADLRKRVKDPVTQDQGAASLCCPASFFYCVLNYKPELYVQYVIDLFTTGKARSDAPPPGPPPRDPAATLQRVQLFADMDRRQAEQIARLLKVRPFAKGETVIMEGSGAAAFFVIESGEATVSSKGVQLATLGPGDHFGEIALIDGGPRSATVTAATDLVCYGLTFWEFRPLIERNGAIGWKLLQALAKRLRAAGPK